MDDDSERVKAVVLAPVAGGGGSARGWAADATGIVTAPVRGESIRAAERLVDAIALAREQTDLWREWAQDEAAARAADGVSAAKAVPRPTRAPELLGQSPGAHVLRALRSLAPGDVDAVLMGLPFADALDLLRWTALALSRGAGVEVCSRAASSILRTHGLRLAASPLHRPLLAAARDALGAAARAARDAAGVNAAGLRHLDRVIHTAQVSKLAFGEVLAQDVLKPAGANTKNKQSKGGKGGKRRRGEAPALF